jgi:hypothetical protein
MDLVLAYQSAMLEKATLPSKVNTTTTIATRLLWQTFARLSEAVQQ